MSKARPRPRAVADYLARETRRVMDEGNGDKAYGADACIAAARITSEVAQRFGHRARPLSVRATVLNEPYARLLEEIGPIDKENQARYVREGAWSVVVGHHDEQESMKTEQKRLLEGRRPGWNGHVVTILGEAFIIDPTIVQTARPERGITFPRNEAAAPEREVMRAFLKGETILGGEHANGVTVIYEAFPADKSFVMSRDWTEKQRTTPYVRTLAQGFAG